MQVEFVLDTVVKLTGISRDLLLGADRSTKVRHTRHMTYIILKERCGVSSYKLARIFKRTRRNVIRAMSNMRYHISIYEEVNKEYNGLVEKLECAEKAAHSNNENG